MIGEKTKRLQVLKSAGFNVPEFVAVSSEELVERSISEIAKNALETLPNAALFAVRSSARTEDTHTSSMAGQFLTKLGVVRDGLASAIEEICEDAKMKLKSLDQFSIIIQEFIEADISGVTFTRNPNGGREMVTEFFEGRGDQVVSGKVTPRREIHYRTQKENASRLPDFIGQKEIFLNIESLFAFPQDIEWCIKDSAWHIVQSRPITSLSHEQNEMLIMLENLLPKEGRFYFAKNEVTDVAPQPSPATLGILRKMYAQNGPVHRAYKKIGVTYRDTDFLKMVMGDLYIDKEKELLSLFPSHSYFFTNDYKPRPVRISGFLTSLRNAHRIVSLRGNVDQAYEGAKHRLGKSLPSDSSFEACVKEFLDEYENIFTTSLYAKSALQNLERSLPRSVSLTEALTFFPENLKEPLVPPTDIVGNTFELTDTSLFVASAQQRTSQNIPKGISLEKLRTAQEFLRLREYGRWIALHHISRMRRKMDIPKQELQSAVALPATLTDTPLPQTQKPMGVSAGRVTGRLTASPEDGGILVTAVLTPELAAYADRLQGVIADHGGLLSHFAIIAREKSLPVIVNYPINSLRIGEQVTIDGTTGEVVL